MCTFILLVGAVPGCSADVFLPCAFPDADAAVQRFSRVLSFATVSNAASEHHVADADEFQRLDKYLSEAYAKVIGAWDRNKGGRRGTETGQGGSSQRGVVGVPSHREDSC